VFLSHALGLDHERARTLFRYLMSMARGAHGARRARINGCEVGWIERATPGPGDLRREVGLFAALPGPVAAA
jgi:hypothetical protein